MSEPLFIPFPKIPRLNRDIVVTEKIDGTNAGISVEETVRAASRNRWITPDKDNFGFARWVQENASELGELLGPGMHFGEWWGSGIQRRYGQTTKRFSLFNVSLWRDLKRTVGGVPIESVPLLYEGPFSGVAIQDSLEELGLGGSAAAPGWKPAEGIVVFHTAASSLFKVTLEGDGKPKGVS